MARHYANQCAISSTGLEERLDIYWDDVQRRIREKRENNQAKWQVMVGSLDRDYIQTLPPF